MHGQSIPCLLLLSIVFCAVPALGAGICDRTPGVIDIILDHIDDIDACGDVTAEHLSGITGDLRGNGRGLTSLQAGDFAGLSSIRTLTLYDNDLDTVPAGLLSGGLDSLRTLYLDMNNFTTLPSGLWDYGVPTGEFWAIRNQITSLPDGFWVGVPSMSEIHLDENPGDEALEDQDASWNPGSPIPQPVQLEASDGAVKAYMPTGVSTDVVMGIETVNGTASASTLTIASGTMRSSMPVTVTRTAGTTDAVTVRILWVCASYPPPSSDGTCAYEHARWGLGYAYSATPTVVVPAIELTPPTDLTATNITSTSATLSWTMPGTFDPVGYQVLWRDKDVHPVGHFEILDVDTGSTATTYAAGSLTPNTRYVFRVKAIADGGALTERSHWVDVTTLTRGASADDPDSTRAGATTLDAIAALQSIQWPWGSLDKANGDRVDYYTFTLPLPFTLGFGVRKQTINIDATLEDANGNTIIASWPPPVDASIEWLKQDLDSGTYYLRVEAMEDGATRYMLRFGLH